MPSEVIDTERETAVHMGAGHLKSENILNVCLL